MTGFGKRLSLSFAMRFAYGWFPSKRKMIEFEVRHGITNHEADIGAEKSGSGRYILGPAHHFQLDVPPGNALAVYSNPSP